MLQIIIWLWSWVLSTDTNMVTKLWCALSPKTSPVWSWVHESWCGTSHVTCAAAPSNVDKHITEHAPSTHRAPCTGHCHTHMATASQASHASHASRGTYGCNVPHMYWVTVSPHHVSHTLDTVWSESARISHMIIHDICQTTKCSVWNIEYYHSESYIVYVSCVQSILYTVYCTLYNVSDVKPIAYSCIAA